MSRKLKFSVLKTRARHTLVLLLCAIAFGPLSTAQAATPPQPATASAAAEKRPLADLLTPQGTLELPRGYNSSVDVRGYRMEITPGGEPRFLPATDALEPAADGDERWDDRFALRGVGCCTVHALAVDGDDVYIGGEFNEAGGVASTSIVRWDGRRFWALGEGVKNTANGQGAVYDIAVAGDEVYVGGRFVMAGTTPAVGIARWDGSAWSAVGTGQGTTSSNCCASPVYAVAVAGDDLYIGGEFTEVDGVPAASIARWNGTAWQALDSGLTYSFGGNGVVYTLAAGDDGVYVGGRFNRAGDQVANAIAHWRQETGDWSALDEGVAEQGGSLGEVRVLAFDEATGSLYAGGRFTLAGGKTAHRIARWDGADWMPLGGGVDLGATNTEVLAIHIGDDGLYIGGDFATAGGIAAPNLARWDGAAWRSVDQGVNAAVYALAGAGDGITLGGRFDSAGELPLNYVAHWDNGWYTLGQGVSSGKQCCGRIEAVAVSGNGEVYVGGFFAYAGNIAANNIAMWDGSRWHALGAGTDGTVYAIAVAGNDVYVGGTFAAAGNANANNVARWDRATQTWHALGNGADGNVYDLLVHGPYVYMGGSFTKAGGVESYVARWHRTTEQWSGLGERLFFGGPGAVRSIARSGDLFVLGGRFGYVYLDDDNTPILANSLLAWDSVADEWRFFAGGVTSQGNTGTVYDLAFISDALYVGGDFSNAGEVFAPALARFDDDGWSALGTGLTGDVLDVYALAVRGQTLYAGGNFDTAGALAAGNIARWDHTTGSWSTLGSGIGGNPMFTDPVVRALSDAGADVYVGGDFATAGAVPAHTFARWVDALPAAVIRLLPETGGTLAATGVELQFPANAVTERVTISLTPLAPVAPAPEAVQRVLQSWQLTARTDSGQLLRQFAQEYTLTVSYDEAALAAQGIAESGLTLSYWDGAAWVAMASTIDADNDRVTGTADGVTAFALIGDVAAPEAQSTIYLPAIARP